MMQQIIFKSPEQAFEMVGIHEFIVLGRIMLIRIK